MKNFKKVAKNTALMIYSVVGSVICVVIILWLVGIIKIPIQFNLNSNRLPSQYINDRTNFTASLLYYSNSSTIANNHGNVNQVTASLSQSISSSKKVSASFLNYLNPQLNAEYRNNLIAGEQDYLNGLEESGTNINSPNAVLQEQGIQLERNWSYWWSTNSKAISNKSFAD